MHRDRVRVYKIVIKSATLIKLQPIALKSCCSSHFTLFSGEKFNLPFVEVYLQDYLDCH